MFSVSLGCFALTSSNLMRFADDVALFTRATESAPRSARAQQNLGSALLRKERVAEAATALGRAVELDPTLLAARVNLGLLEEVRGNPDAAREHYRLAVELPRVVAEQPLAARACERLGSLLVRSGRRDEAEQQLERERARGADSACVAAFERSLASP